MRNRIAFKISFVFFLIYGLASTFGSIFLVSWGGDNAFKRTMLFFSSIPFDWNVLIAKSLWFMLLNIVFWSLIVYLLAFLIISLVLKLGILKYEEKKRVT